MLQGRILSIVILVAFGLSYTLHAQERPSFEKKIQPIFAKHCFSCHGKQQKAELDLRSAGSIRKGSESGTILDTDKPSEGRLFEVIRDGEMPPEGKPQLSAAEKKTILEWLEKGAQFEKSAKAEDEVVSQHSVLPILRLRCTVCHGRQKQEAGLDLRTRASMLKGGKSGPAMVIGKPKESLLLKRVHAGEMPPKGQLAAASVKPMTAGEVKIVTEWIQKGAVELEVKPDIATTSGDPLVNDEDRRFWAFQPPQPVAVPNVDSNRIQNPIDAFLLKQLHAAKLDYSEPADRLTLLRRASTDLLGLPPTEDQVEQFLGDSSANAYERMIDSLLSSPRYGERWGRFWLDLAGYMDSEGVQHADRVRPEAYRYRDYVIRSLNKDKPYNRFLLEQIAGDELADYRNQKINEEIYDNLVATGFLRMAPDGTYAGITAFVPNRLETIDHEIEVLTSSTMGLTLRCARCHSHKFDPIPQRDYYRLTAVFKGAYDEHDWLDPTKNRYLPFVHHAEQAKWKHANDQVSQQIEQVNKDLSAKEKAALKKLGLEKLDRVELRKRDKEFDKLAKDAEAKIKALEGRRPRQPMIRALWDRGEPTPTYVLKRGDYLNQGRLVGPGFPSVLSDGKTPLEVKAPFPGATGRRLAFAKWLVQPEHPLTARVMVNRIWKHHFGEGIVRTLDNFGKAGARPTHPQLLDWLAREFVSSGWSIKSMHRLMMNSAAYRQSSDVDVKREERDPSNRLLSRMPMRRMEGESIRDALLFASGRLDLRQFGPADAITVRADGLVLAEGKNDTWRRTVYVQQRRISHLTILDNFDLPRMSPNCIDRRVSVVAPQALHLLNNKRIYELSQHFAQRVLQDAKPDVDDRIRKMYLLATGRPPSQEEQKIAKTVLEQLAAEWRERLKGAEVRIPASTHLWIRQSQPDKVYEKDLISVWSSKTELRFGVVEFDVSKLGDVEWREARLELGVLGKATVRQTARLIEPGISGLTWNRFHQEKQEQRLLERFGRIEDLSKVAAGEYASSAAATDKDLATLRQASKGGRIALVLVADEDGKPYKRDWDDGEKGHLPQLVVRLGNTVDEEEVSRRAFQNLCHAIMNSAAFIFVD